MINCPAGSTTLKSRPPLADLLRRKADAVVAQRRRAKHRPSPAALHDLRVATRRLQEVLALLRPWLPRVPRGRLVRRARRLRQRVGPMRDADVMAALVAALARKAPADLRDPIEAVAVAMRRDAAMRRERLAARGVPRVARRARRLRRRLGPVTTSMLRRRGMALAARRLDALEEAIPAALRTRGARALHETRRLLKKYRYTLEALDAAGAIEAGAALAEVRALQTALGDLRDHDLMAAEVRGAIPAALRPRLAAFLARRRRPLQAEAIARLSRFDATAVRRRLLSALPGGAAA